jgi:epoxyqueuosine reductase
LGINKDNLTHQIKQFALNEAGFDLVGFSVSELPAFYEQGLNRWIEKGHAGTMAYMARDPKRRSHSDQVLPSVRSVISLALNYYHPEDPKPENTRTGKVAKYAYGKDYHSIIEEKLKKLKSYIQEIGGEGTEVKDYVDTGPVLEKAYAKEAGLGFFGKNTNIITREYGSWVLLASILTNLELEPDKPHAGSCGSCRICIDACPTDALLGNYEMDARRCISYLTIETKAPVPQELSSKFGDWVFGCDICQDVCPYNFRAKVTKEEELYPLKKAGTWIDLNPVQLPAQSPLKRSKYLKQLPLA